ncbi:MAG: hypothetical protein IPM16_02590 [Chloroflexi bacterium]|nr:hypothetical protein [Chloroflexota bacterium]
MATFFLSRDGNISVFKVGVVIAIVGGLLVVGGFILASIEQNTFRSPLEVPIPPETTVLATDELSPASRRIFYESLLEPEDVFRYYDRLLAEQDGVDINDPNRERCIRNPSRGDFESYTPGDGSVPFEYRCLFQQISLLGIDKATLITIQPGVRNDATGQNFEGTTRIDYEQYWEP